jgi:hypothetical protein
MSCVLKIWFRYIDCFIVSHWSSLRDRIEFLYYVVGIMADVCRDFRDVMASVSVYYRGTLYERSIFLNSYSYRRRYPRMRHRVFEEQSVLRFYIYVPGFEFVYVCVILFIGNHCGFFQPRVIPRGSASNAIFLISR